MKTIKSVWVLLPLLFVAGCATSSREQSVTFKGRNDENLQPTSNRDQSRVYSDTSKVQTLTASAEDSKLGEEVRQLIMQNKKLAPAPSNLTITTHDGVVTLRGSIPTRRTGEDLSEQIAQLPGVARVDNQLEPRSGY